MQWKKLQNGSDIRGVAIEGVEGQIVNLTSDVSEKLGKSLVKWLKINGASNDISVAVGTDSRISGPALKSSFIAGISKAGSKTYDCGYASTPAMFMTTIHDKTATTAGVMITASHLPFNRNGFKFFTNKGGLNKSDIANILEIAEEDDFEDVHEVGEITKWNFIEEYSNFLIDTIRKGANSSENYEKPLTGLKIIVDAGNGTGGFFASKVLEPLGADTSGSQFLEPDGYFPNHVPNPEDSEAMQSICNAVIRKKADLGIIFDTDVDRAAIVDKNGNPVNRNALIALISAVILNEHPGSTIVTDSITSEGLTDFIETHLQGKHHRFKRGYKNVINESIRLNNEGVESYLAIETSGHAALKENHFLDDGAFLVAKLLIEAAKMNEEGLNLTDLIVNLKQPVESKEFRLSIKDNDFSTYGNSVLQNLEKKVEDQEGWEIVMPNYEGIRVSCNGTLEKGWFLLRMSLHDPVMPLNIESNIEGGVSYIREKLSRLLSEFEGLDVKALSS